MIKREDKVKGFRFKTSSGVNWNPIMEKYVDFEGIVIRVRPEINEVVIRFMDNDSKNMQHWIYPLDECITLQRDNKLKELGII